MSGSVSRRSTTFDNVSRHLTRIFFLGSIWTHWVPLSLARRRAVTRGGKEARPKSTFVALQSAELLSLVPQVRSAQRRCDASHRKVGWCLATTCAWMP